MKKLLLFSLTLFLFALLAACSVGNSASPAGEWRLVSYGDVSNLTPALPNVETSINFDEKGQLSGNVGCNSFGADYKVSGDEIVFGSIMSTMMFCEETSTQESAVLGILSDKSVSYELDSEQLTISTKDGTFIMILTRK